jgi:hypothetical protein
MALPNLNDLLAKRNSLESQLNQASAPTSQNEALRYLQQGVDNFRPLQQERQGLLTQANDLLPQQINEYTTQRQANPMQGVSSRVALQNILQNQNRLRGTANLVGDTIEGARGRLGDLSRDALSMLGQQNANLGRQFDIANQDYNTQKQMDFQAQQSALARRGSGGGGIGGFPSLPPRPSGGSPTGDQPKPDGEITLTEDPKQDLWKSTNNLVNNLGNNFYSGVSNNARQLSNLFGNNQFSRGLSSGFNNLFGR